MKGRDMSISRGILFTDFYQLTMAQLYFQEGLAEKESEFEYFFRKYPDYGQHRAGYCVNAGIGWIKRNLVNTQFTRQDISFLKSQKSSSGAPLFKENFLNWLQTNVNFKKLNIKFIEEGRIVHPNTPIAVIRGPLSVAQLFESAFLNHMNYQTLIATKASRIYEAAEENLTIDFGMRRAHGFGANEGARAALIGGADFTSNTGISEELGFPPKGTHAHSLVQAFIASGKSELEAFTKYAELYPDDCLLLVDTIDTLKSGMPNALKVFNKLKKKGHEPLGIRIDSGDLAYLSIRCAMMLNDAGFKDCSIVLSNQLDEMVVWQILSQIRQNAEEYGIDPEKLISRLVYGVGTNLITSSGHSALDGVYKLTSIKISGKWRAAFKSSETPEKKLNPGRKKLWRIYDKAGKAIADVIGTVDEDITAQKTIELFHPHKPDLNREISLNDISSIEPLLVEYDIPELDSEKSYIKTCRKRREKDLKNLYTGVKRIINPHIYHVSLTKKLNNLKNTIDKKFKI